MPQEAPSRSLPTVLTLLGLGTLVLLGWVNAFLLTVDFLDQNESLYLSAGWSMKEGYRLYEDFSFWQMPYSPMLYAGVFGLFQPENHLFAGKLTSVALFILAQLSFGAMARLLSGRWWLALAVMAATSLNLTLVRCAMEASNYILPVTFSCAAMCCLCVGLDRERRSRWWLALGGCLFAGAVATKLYYLVAAGGAGLAVLLAPGPSTRRERVTRRLLPYGLGFGIGLLPALPFVLHDLQLAWLNNIGAHRITTTWWHEVAANAQGGDVGAAIRLTLPDQLAFSWKVLSHPANLLLIGLLVVVVVLRLRAPREDRRRDPVLWLGVLTLGVSIPVAYVPTPMWYRYLGPPVSFAAVLLVIELTRLLRARPRLTAVLASLWIVAGLYGMRTFLAPHWERLRSPDDWVSISLPRSARRLAQHAPPGSSGRLLTFQPLLAMESGRWTPYPEFSHAPFSYVMADDIPEPLKSRSPFSGRKDLDSLLKEQPPAAVLTGLYDGTFWSEQDLDRWAVRNGYRIQPTRERFRLYLPPTGK